VGQAWRVKPLVWHNYDAWTWWAESTSGTYRVEERNGTWRATLNLPMTEHIIYEYQTDDTTRDDFEAAHLACQSDHEGRIIAAIEPTSTTAELERLRAALTKLRDLMCEGFEDDDGNSGCGKCENDCTGCIADRALKGGA